MMRAGEPGVPLVPQLRRLREEAALSQRDLARLAGVARTTIFDLERGASAARPSTIRKLARALNCTPRELLRENPPVRENPPD
jgi:transcriptional regulator with XRE-family HTH domain